VDVAEEPGDAERKREQADDEQRVGMWLSTHRPSPFWGRAADIADTLLIISLFPLALGVAGLFGYIHGLGG
jgi:hypothetical protein